MNGKRILIVEDHPVLARNIARYLVRRGCVVTTACSALEALTGLRSEVVDAILLDVNLPDSNGLDFFEQIRTLYPLVEVYLMSGHISQQAENRARTLGVNTILTKPFPLSQLGSLVDGALHQCPQEQ